MSSVEAIKTHCEKKHGKVKIHFHHLHLSYYNLRYYFGVTFNWIFRQKFIGCQVCFTHWIMHEMYWSYRFNWSVAPIAAKRLWDWFPWNTHDDKIYTFNATKVSLDKRVCKSAYTQASLIHWVCFLEIFNFLSS